jgi:hypothetical protein
MSSLTQRFLSALDTEWSYLSVAERESEKQRVAQRLDDLVRAEQELGADEYEAQRRAVRAVGQECQLRPQTSVRLAPVWQVALIWVAVRAVAYALLGLIFRMEELTQGVMVSWLGLGIVPAVLATIVARLWHPRAALRGILYGLGTQIVFFLINAVQLRFVTLPIQLPAGLSADLLFRYSLISLVGMVLVTLGTLLFVPEKPWKKVGQAFSKRHP